MVARLRGSASSHACAHCGGAAQQWAYDHLDADERLEVRGGHLVPYSLDAARYLPLCVSCHVSFDQGPREICARGHALSETAIARADGGRQCGRCKADREASEGYRARANARRRAKRTTPPPSERTHCPQGHPYAGDNLQIHANGDRRCAECNRQRARAWREKRASAA